MLQLRDYQDEAVYSLFDYFAQKQGNPAIAMPTGTGKSLVISEFIRRALYYYSRTRVLMATHVKELIEQNADKLQKMWPTAPLGIHSAGLKQRDTMLPIIFGGIQTMYRKPELFGYRDLLIIDEAHLLSPNNESMYQTFIASLKSVNPSLKVIGLTATPYRMRQGMITDGGLFTDLCFDITGFESFNRLIACGYLSPLIPKKAGIEIDVSQVGVSQSSQDYKGEELEEAAEKIVIKGCQEVVQVAENRRSWMIFASGIKNAEHIAEILRSFGVSAAAVHSGLDKHDKNENKLRIEDFKRGQLRCLVNMNKLTTGFDYPPIDYIGMFRPTLSPGLWVQMLGRGTRPSPETNKVNCLCSDFTPNSRVLGPINDVAIPCKPNSKKEGMVPVKICSACGTYNHISARVCINCYGEFTFENKLKEIAADVPLMRGDENVVEYFKVQKVIYNLHQKKKDGVPISPPMMKVTYYCGLHRFNKFIMFEHSGYAARQAREWWRQHHPDEPPETTFEALRRCAQLREPARVRVWLKHPYPEILGYEY